MVKLCLKFVANLYSVNAVVTRVIKLLYFKIILEAYCSSRIFSNTFSVAEINLK